MLKVRKDLTGKRFGRITVIQQVEDYVSPKGHRKARWLCNCDCGNKNFIVVGSDLTSKKTKSCGCLHDELSRKRFSIVNKKYNTYDLTGDYGVGYTSKGKEFYFDLEDYELIKDYCWHSDNKGYIKTTIHESKGVKHDLFLHRLVMGLPNSELYVDHKRGENTRHDNRKSNLRIATHSQNMMNKNRIKSNKSGVTGVYWSKLKQRWVASITANKRKIYLGQYINFDDAVKARKEAEEKYFGEFAYNYNNES